MLYISSHIRKSFPFLPSFLSAHPSISLFFSSTFLGSLCAGASPAPVALFLGSAGPQLNTKMYICTSEPFDVISLVCWGSSGCFECTYWHSMCYLLSVSCSSFTLPMSVDFSLGYPEGRELAFLQLSFFFNFSPSEVVLIKYKIFLRNKTSKKLKI